MKRLCLIAASGLLSGCAALHTPLETPVTVKLTATGYGAPGAAQCESQCDRVTEGQRRLLAMRASKLDAYRAMAEQVYGVRVTGNSTVGALALKDDSFRVFIDATIRGAHVTNVSQGTDGNFETTIEMDFDANAARAAAQQIETRTAAVPVANQATRMRGAVGAGASYGGSFYYAEK